MNKKAILLANVVLLAALTVPPHQEAKAAYPDVQGYATTILAKIQKSGINMGPYPATDFLQPDGRTTLIADIEAVQAAAAGDAPAPLDAAIGSLDRLRYFSDFANLKGVKTLERDRARLQQLANN